MIKNDTSLTFRVYKKDLNKTTLTLETTDHEACLCQAITMLYDKVIGRYNLKIKHYTKDDKEYCYLEQKQIVSDTEYSYIISGLRSEWGGLLNINKTLKDNNIKIS